MYLWYFGCSTYRGPGQKSNIQVGSLLYPRLCITAFPLNKLQQASTLISPQNIFSLLVLFLVKSNFGWDENCQWSTVWSTFTALPRPVNPHCNLRLSPCSRQHVWESIFSVCAHISFTPRCYPSTSPATSAKKIIWSRNSFKTHRRQHLKDVVPKNLCNRSKNGLKIVYIH